MNNILMVSIALIVDDFFLILRNRSEYMCGETVCRLCNANIDNVTILRVHLMSRLHQDREKRIGFSRSLV